jgi:hypothetical protein
MHAEDRDLAYLHVLVYQAHADIRRVESVTPALIVGAVVGCLPVILLLVALPWPLRWG